MVLQYLPSASYIRTSFPWGQAIYIKFGAIGNGGMTTEHRCPRLPKASCERPRVGCFGGRQGRTFTIKILFSSIKFRASIGFTREIQSWRFRGR